MKTIGFIARAECYETKAFNGKVLTEDGAIVTFTIQDGYPQCSKGCSKPHLFGSAQEALNQAPNYDAMPWYCRLKPGTVKVYEIVEVEPARPAIIEEREVK